MKRVSLIWSCVMALGMATVAQASVIVTAVPSGSIGSTTDAFDVSQGSSIVGSSPVNSVSAPANAIGGTSATYESNAVVFSDNITNTELLTFKTASAVTIGGFDILLAEDGAGNGSLRGFSSVSLLGSTDGTSFVTLASADLGSGTYVSTYGSNTVDVTATFDPVTYQYFQFQGVNRLDDTQSYNGGRLLEIDALPADTASVPEPASWACFIAGFGMVGGTMRRRKAIPNLA